jgi:hypothetical protein
VDSILLENFSELSGAWRFAGTQDALAAMQ